MRAAPALTGAIRREVELRTTSLFLAVAATALATLTGTAQAAGPRVDLDLHYKFFLGGARIAKMDLRASIDDAGYKVEGNGETIGFVANFADLAFSGSTKGVLAGDGIRPGRHEHRLVQGGERRRHVIMTYDKRGRPKVAAEPGFSYGGKRLPIKPEHMPGTLDPVSPFVVPVKAGASPLHPSQCDRAVAIFDGEQRFDVTYKHKSSYGAFRLDKAGYNGPAIRCVARFTPVAGYYRAGFFPFLAKRRDIDVVLAPAADGRYLVPLRVRFPTPVGQAVLEATRFNVQTAKRSASAGRN